MGNKCIAITKDDKKKREMVVSTPVTKFEMEGGSPIKTKSSKSKTINQIQKERYVCSKCQCKKDQEINRLDLMIEIIRICKECDKLNKNAILDKIDHQLENYTQGVSAASLQQILEDIESGNYEQFFC